MNAETYKRIVETCFPRLHVGRITWVSEGWDSVAVEIDGRLIFRFPKRPDIEAQYEKEWRLLPTLADALSLPIPRMEFAWPGGAAFPTRFLGYRKIDGVPLCADHLTPARAGDLAGQLARFLSELHGFPVQRAVVLGLPDTGPDEWRREYQDLYDQVRARVFPLLEWPARDRVVVLWEGFLADAANVGFRPALIHRDLTGDHILCDGDRLTGIIDWGDAGIGDPAIDFAGLLHDYGDDFTARVLAGYRGEAGGTFRGRVAFYCRIIPFHEVLFGLATGDEGHVRQGLAALCAAE